MRIETNDFDSNVFSVLLVTFFLSLGFPAVLKPGPMAQIRMRYSFSLSGTGALSSP
jgi:hypothetical protein